MELRQLGYFVAVARERSFTRAARRLRVAQPGVSQQIRRLEAELDVRLLDRSGTPVRLTPAGEALLPYARDALAAAESGRAVLAGLRGEATGRLALGTIPGIPAVDLAGLLAGFCRDYPHVDVSLREDQPLPLIEAIRRDELDAAVVGLSRPDAPVGLSVELLAEEPLVLVTAAGHRLTGRDGVAVGELRDEPVVTAGRGTALRRHIEQACDAAGYAPRILLETDDLALIRDLVAHGLGVTIVPRSIAESGAVGRSLRVLTLDPPVSSRYVALAWRTARSRSPVADAFIGWASAWHARHRAPGADAGQPPTPQR